MTTVSMRCAPLLMMLIADVFPGGCCGGAHVRPLPTPTLPARVESAVTGYATLRPNLTGGAADVAGRCVDESVCEAKAVGDALAVGGKSAGSTEVVISFTEKLHRAERTELHVQVSVAAPRRRPSPLSPGLPHQGAAFALPDVKLGGGAAREYTCFPRDGAGLVDKIDVGDIVRGDAEVLQCYPPQEIGAGTSYFPLAMIDGLPAARDDETLHACVHRTTRDVLVVSISMYQWLPGGSPTLVEHRGPPDEVCSLKPRPAP